MMAGKPYVPQRIAASLGEYYQQGWDTLWQSGQKLQDEVLAEIVNAAKGSDYARDHGFDAVSPEEFLLRAPISEYNDYLPYIKSNMKTGGHELTTLPLSYYLMSSGSTTGRNNYFPETEVAAIARETAINLWNMIVSQKEPIMAASDGKMLAVINNSPIDSAPNGKPIRRASGQATKGLWEKFPAMYVHPYEFFEIDCSTDDRAYLLALYTLREANFTMGFCNNLDYFGVLLDAIDRNANRMIDDIRHGGASMPLRKEDRAKLASSLVANPARADELEALFAADGRIIPSKAWPNFACTATWLAGSIGAFGADVRYRLPNEMRYYPESYGASEGMFNIPIEHGVEDGPLAAFSCYYEFLPLGAIPGTHPLPMGETETGKFYELVITTYSGFYRYNLHDIVRIDGRTGDTANIAFCCRSIDRLNLNGRNFYAFSLFDIMREQCHDFGAVATMYQAMEEGGRLSVLVEFYKEPSDMQAFRNALFRKLETESIEGGNVYIMRNGWRQSLYDARKQSDRTEQTIKLPPVAHELRQEDVKAVF